MGKHNANNFKVMLETTDGSGTYADAAFISTNSIPLSNAAIDGNNKTDGPEQCLIPGGLISWDTSFEGIASDDASLQKLIDINTGNGIDGNSWRFRTEWRDNQGNLVGTFDCILFLESIELGGGINEALTFSGSLRSSGSLAYTPAP